MTPDSSGLRAVILAAGLGTRMKSRTPKVLHEICGRPMLAYVIDAAREATGRKPLVVYSPQTAQLCDVFAEMARRERLFGIAEKLLKTPAEADPRRKVVALETRRVRKRR